MRTTTVGAACVLSALATPFLIPSLAAAPAGAGVLPTPDPLPAEPAFVPDMREGGVRIALDRHLAVARKKARVAGRRLAITERRSVRRRLDDLPPTQIARRTVSLRSDLRGLRKRLRARETAAPVPGHLQAIASCESGGDPGAVDPSGTYRGKYQFDMGTWASVGGSGDPAAAPEAEQDRRAGMLYARSGAAPWPVCGS